MQSDALGAIVREERSAASARRRIVGVAVVTLVSTMVTMALGLKIWALPPGAPAPPAGLVPYFVMLELVGDVLFGLGVSFVIFGYGLVARARQPLWLTYAAYVLGRDVPVAPGLYRIRRVGLPWWDYIGHQRLELETDLIGAYVLATHNPPAAQFISSP